MASILADDEVDAVIVYTSDRLSRNYIDFLVLRDQWEKAGIELHYVDRGKTKNNFEGLLTDGIFALLAHGERIKIMERTKHGRLCKARAGKWVGSGDPPYGYRREGIKQDVKLVIDSNEAKIVRRIFSDYVGDNGHGKPKQLQQIARELTEEGIHPPGSGKGWYRASLYRIIKNPIYKGSYVYGNVIVDIPDILIIENDLWEATQQQCKRNKVFSKRNRKREYLLSGMIFCPCGIRMYSQAQQQGKYLYYKCGSNTYKKHLERCPTKMVRADIAGKLIWEWLRDLLLDSKSLKEGLMKYTESKEYELEPKRERLATIIELIQANERKMDKLTDELTEFDGTVRDAIRHKLKDISEILDRLNDQHHQLLVEIQTREITNPDVDSIELYANKIRQRLTCNPTYDQKRALLMTLNLKVNLREDNAGRWLDVSCGLKLDSDSVPLDGQGYPIPYRPC